MRLKICVPNCIWLHMIFCLFFTKSVCEDLLNGSYFISVVCNFMSHEKCLKNVKIPCSCIAPSLVRVSKHTRPCFFLGVIAQIYH